MSGTDETKEPETCHCGGIHTHEQWTAEFMRAERSFAKLAQKDAEIATLKEQHHELILAIAREAEREQLKQGGQK